MCYFLFFFHVKLIIDECDVILRLKLKPVTNFGFETHG